eukprot:g5042.t1
MTWREICMLVVFCMAHMGRDALGLASSLNPIFDQPSTILVGKAYAFGQPLVPASLLDKHGISGYSVAGVNALDGEQLVGLNSLRVENASTLSYEAAYELASIINTGSLNLGACVSKDTSGGLADGAFHQYRCKAYGAITRRAAERWMELERASCKPAVATPLAIDRVFHGCLKFTSHNPGSMYVLAGQVTHGDEPLACSYEAIDVKPWAELTVDDAARSPPHFKTLNTHTLVCDGPHHEGLQGGFFTESRQQVRQVWTSKDHVMPFAARCAAQGGSYRELRAWRGDVEMGTHQLVQWCRDCGWVLAEGGADTGCNGDADGATCWEHVLGLLDPSDPSFQTWKALEAAAGNSSAKSLPARMLDDALHGRLDISASWLEFEYALLALARQQDDAARASALWSSNSREAFRSVFGWGFDTKRQVVPLARWTVTERALYNAAVLAGSEGTRHNVWMQCIDEAGTAKAPASVHAAVMFEEEAPENTRTQGLLVTVSRSAKAINVVIGFALFALSLGTAFIPDSRALHFVVGAGFLLVLAAAWPFETSGRTMLIAGVGYAAFTSYACLTWPNACEYPHDIHALDHKNSSGRASEFKGENPIHANASAAPPSLGVKPPAKRKARQSAPGIARLDSIAE